MKRISLYLAFGLATFCCSFQYDGGKDVVPDRVENKTSTQLTEKKNQTIKETKINKTDAGLSKSGEKENSTADDENRIKKAVSALLDEIRGEQNPFGAADPERFERLPAKKVQNGKYHWGAFRIDVEKMVFSADVMSETAGNFYNGNFIIEKDGSWKVAAIKHQHMRQQMKVSKHKKGDI